MIAFVAGGARSGKSAVAEALAMGHLAHQPREARGALVYLATARVGDDEMAARVARHRRERGEGWLTCEAPLELADALDGVKAGSSVLLDCLTLWAGQWLFEAERDEAAGRAMLEWLIASARRRDIALVVVSNDLNEDLPPRDALVWRYLAFLQRLHRDLAEEADRVIEVVAGRAVYWKDIEGKGIEEKDIEGQGRDVKGASS
ncbi:bifunctional adenosylcobinamide kinase/adenosylcobinamide-phosphate guanylyltransferase [Halomonas saccharevitans]|uniref:Bifunctional adenosylcobalamin biosynthesis protein n=1 Tax=Halomonas saccharevitans TaxID=416872 RepID=A0A1I7AM45_9GAMM|nr:bifunctional adenosylcobinamide kinase/adenosylcobinamide-phosphate guanylyltransferase [Halomonas saccharevitans]SFT76018.1 adenosylcobinamide kinase /adenosylcobinamide-phosphate guanylyltransferase [Halomonas saccharevitans]